TQITINDPRITINNYMIITWLVTWQLHVKRKHKLPSMTHELPLIITCAITWLVTWQLHVKRKTQIAINDPELPLIII
ncbi:MAG: hypothetical protein IKQ37_03380, partial [Bacteroidaceae bacterium]|nr:hypothetical protein [Bacteroidaceae bacterium]